MCALPAPGRHASAAHFDEKQQETRAIPVAAIHHAVDDPLVQEDADQALREQTDHGTQRHQRDPRVPVPVNQRQQQANCPDQEIGNLIGIGLKQAGKERKLVAESVHG